MDGEQKIRDVLVKFEEIIENHSNNLNQLENLIAINQPDVERCHRIVKRIRRTRKELYDGLKVIIEHYPSLKDEKIKQETLGIVSYLNLIGFTDEMELLRSAEDLLRKAGVSLNIQADLTQLEELVKMTSKLSF
ncbi:hypothetical protein L3N51_00218 [Metallosphaera sp. J1]|uniref:hypothetical protein n=1 Tax=Metallosphaera TaxID=41980 RepID=UPI001EDD0AA3|nr:hypothetical protein [Metallosphaera javensis (ex Hofmann et al. 2022)]MCG3107944.1 hypothetical protein [Metallosphaera javensis (ex Hofmann et al. 2022)]BCS91900.1 MAG: hypothetical protein MjAS7_0508 [Metallosphaera javensis (ex Sakai et al. 2022)]